MKNKTKFPDSYFFLFTLVITILIFIYLKKSESSRAKLLTPINIENVENTNIHQLSSPFSIHSLGEDSTISLVKKNDKVMVINFLASWCGPCKRELPSIISLKDNLRGNESIEFLFLSNENKKTISQMARNYPSIEKNFYSYRKNEVPQFFRKERIPATYIMFNKKIYFWHVGAVNWNTESVKKLLESLTKQI